MRQLVDRLAGVPPWRLWLFLLFPIGSSVVFFTGNLHAGQVGWAIVFGILLALSIAVSLTAIVLKVVSTHRRIPPN